MLGYDNTNSFRFALEGLKWVVTVKVLNLAGIIFGDFPSSKYFGGINFGEFEKLKIRKKKKTSVFSIALGRKKITALN